MAYFPNGTSGMCFDEQCSQCRFGESYCPINYVQAAYNYDACNNTVATAILDELVKDDGTCAMFQMDPTCFRSDASKQQVLPIDDVETARASLAERTSEQTNPCRVRLKAIVNHWNEFGPEAGFEDEVAMAESTLKRTEPTA